MPLKNKCAVLFLLCLALLSVSCSEKCCSEAKEEIKRLESEIRSLKQLRYDVQSLQTSVEELRKKALYKPMRETPIRRSLLPPESSYLDDPFLGDKNSPLIMMAFLDYQCKPCRNFVKDSLPKLREEYIDTGVVRFVVRDFPLNTRPHSFQAAVYANCSGEQGKYWEMFEGLFENHQAVDAGDFRAIASALKGASYSKLEKCVTADKFRHEISSDIESGKIIGAKGAPGFFIAPNRPKQPLDGVLIRGAQPYDVIKAEIEKLRR